MYRTRTLLLKETTWRERNRLKNISLDNGQLKEILWDLSLEKSHTNQHKIILLENVNTNSQKKIIAWSLVEYPFESENKSRIHVYVMKKHRRQGFGKKLFVRAKREAAKVTNEIVAKRWDGISTKFFKKMNIKCECKNGTLCKGKHK